MQKELESQVSRLLEEAEKATQQGDYEKASQSSLKATGIAQGEPLAWYFRSRSAPSHEEQLMCLSRAYALDTKRSEAKTELRNAVQELLQKEPFLAYVYETEELYQVRSGRDLLVNIPKNRVYETPYLKRNPGPGVLAYRWVYLSLLGLLLGGGGALFVAPVAVVQVGGEQVELEVDQSLQQAGLHMGARPADAAPHQGGQDALGEHMAGQHVGDGQSQRHRPLAFVAVEPGHAGQRLREQVLSR